MRRPTVRGLLTLFVSGTLGLVALGGCVSTRPGTGASAPALSRSFTPGPVTLQDIPGLLTVVPFELGDEGEILLPAVIDGRHGEFLFDLGSPVCVLNGKYLQLAPDSSLDTAATGAPASTFVGAMQFGFEEMFGIKNFTFRAVPVYIRTLQLGTLTMAFDRRHRYGVMHTPFAAMLGENAREITANGHLMMGAIGLSALGHVETIIDYAKHRLVLIRVDSAGHRLVSVPAYTPRATVRLIPVENHSLVGVEGTLAGTAVPLALDTGSPTDELDSATISLLGTHAVVVGQDADKAPIVRLDSLRIGDSLYTAHAFSEGESNVLGYPFLRAHGVVGLNFRTRQFILYQ